MSDTNTIFVSIPSLRDYIPVPAELQAEAAAIDNADFEPGNHVISQLDTIADMQPQFRRIAEASLKAYSASLLNIIDTATTDPAMVKTLADKAKLAALAKGELPQLNEQLKTKLRLTGIERADEAKETAYTVRLIDDTADANTRNYFSTNRTELILAPNDTAATFNLKATLAMDRLPKAAQDFLAKHGGESSNLDVPLRKILFTQGFSTSTLGLEKDEDRRTKPPVIDEVTYDAARDRLSVASHLSGYAGRMELQALNAGSTKTLIANWKSADGKSERVTSYDFNSRQWREIGASGEPI